MQKNKKLSPTNLATDKNDTMSLTKEQLKELHKLDHRYEQINKMSAKAGTNPDILLNAFSNKFMDASEIYRKQLAERNEGRNRAFRNESRTSHR